MPQSNQDYMARRSYTCNDRYECELPSDVRTELVSPRRPARPPAKARSKPDKKGPLYFVLAICVVALAVAATTLWRQGDTAERAKISQAISQPLAPLPAPTPVALPPGNAGRWKEYLAHNQPAPRAQLIQPAPRAVLVKLPDYAPRAQLVRLPPLQIGHRYVATMPYGLEVLATFKGKLASLEMLQKSGNQLGDAYVVGNTPWVWIFAPGAAHADWIDP